MSKIDTVKKMILDDMLDLDSTRYNYELYSDLFSRISDKDFDAFMSGLKDKTKTLSIIVGEHNERAITRTLIAKVAKKHGARLHQRMIVKGSDHMPDHITPIEFPVMVIPVRRAVQLLSKKINIPKDSKSIDLMTGQVTGKSKSSRITIPELGIMNGIGLNMIAREFVEMRGGDVGAGNALNKILYEKGSVSMETLDNYRTGVVSSSTLKSYMRAACLASTLPALK